MDTMIELPALRRSAELAPNTVDADARTVEVIWSAGARVRRASFFGEPYDEELSLDPAHVRLDLPHRREVDPVDVHWLRTGVGRESELADQLGVPPVRRCEIQLPDQRRQSIHRVQSAAIRPRPRPSERSGEPCAARCTDCAAARRRATTRS